MAFYAYCLLRLKTDEPWPVLEGIDQHPVFPLRCGKYTMLLSRLDRNFPFTMRSIVEHGQVISRVFETHTVLPMRFSTFFRSEKQIANLILENQKELLEAFCRLRGKAEMRLKLLCPSGALKPGTEQTPSLAASAAGNNYSNGTNGTLDPRSQSTANRLAEQVSEMFRPLEQQMSCRLNRSRELLVDCAHLIESEKVEKYQKVYSTASGHLKEWDLRLSGPWPPYHFLPTSVRLPAPVAAPTRRRVSVGLR